MLQNRATLKQIRFRLLSELRQIYTENESDSIARLILEHAGFPLFETLNDPELVPSPSAMAQMNEILAEIPTGKPIQYILGYTWFCDLKIRVDKNVLIPRPETEMMVELIKEMAPKPPRRIIDLGTGSGCIALALKHYFPDAEVSGADISKRALSVAGENGRLNSLQVKWTEMDLLKEHSVKHPTPYNLVVSNPPYVLKSERKSMARNVKAFEPASALFVEDHDPLVYYSAIASFCNQNLDKKGEVWAEINERMGRETESIFRKWGFKSVHIHRDIHEKERYVNARR